MSGQNVDISSTQNVSGFRHTLALVCECIAVIAVPMVLGTCAFLKLQQTALLSLVVAIAALMCFFGAFEISRPKMRDIMPVAVMAALAVAGRIIFAAVPDFKPVSAIAICAGAFFGRRSGFLVGALAALVSNFFFGQGPWTPWQMYAWGMVGWGAGLLVNTRFFKNPIGVYVYGFLSCMAYGFVLNMYSILGFFQPEKLGEAFMIYAAAIPFDLIHGVATVIFLTVLYFPLRRKAERIKLKYDLER